MTCAPDHSRGEYIKRKAKVYADQTNAVPLGKY